MSDNILYIGDNLEVMKKLKDNSVDCIYTDPEPPLKHYIYVHQNINNLKIYVGYSSQPERRWRLTKNAAFCSNDKQYNEPFYKAIRRDGWTCFTHQVIEEFDNKEEALEAEIFWIEFFRSNRNVYGKAFGYNLHKGGNLPPSHKNRKKSLQHKEKIGLALRGKKHSEERNHNHAKSVETPLTDVQLITIKNSTLSYRTLAQTYHIGNRRIQRIKNDK